MTGTDDPVDRWRPWVERLVFLWPVAVGALLVVVGLAVDSLNVESIVAAATALPGRPLLLLAVLVSVALLGPLWNLVLAAAIHRDAAALAVESVDWQPRGSAYAAAAMAIPPVAVHYLHRRHRHVRPSAGRGWWWIAVPAGVVALVLPFVAIRAAWAPPGTVLVGQGSALAVVPVAAYRDAAHLRAVRARWRPDPAIHLAIATIAGLLLVPLPVYAGYYLVRRGASAFRG